MPGFKIITFRGTAPRISPELLEDRQAQIAKNCKLYSGDLLGFPQSVLTGSNGLTATTKTLYAQKNPSTSALSFYAWDKNVSIATPSFSDVEDQRFYYTGDGVPKVSTYKLATSSGLGTAPFPNDWYELGLPLPSTKLNASATAFSQKTSFSIARDSSGTATVVTSAPHNLRTGNSVSISGFSTRTASCAFDGTTTSAHTITLSDHGYPAGASIFISFSTPSVTASLPTGYYTVQSSPAPTTNTFAIENRQTSAGSAGTAVCQVSIADFNSPTVQVTVVDNLTFNYPSPGPEMTTLVTNTGRITLGETPQLRTYVYTWVTPWLEESIGSEPSADLILKEGQVVTVTNLPTAKPSVPAKNFISGVRVYRTYTGPSAGGYFLLKTLWWPQLTARVARTDNVSQVTMSIPHNFIEGDRFKLAGCTDTSFDITGGVVTNIVDSLTFEYAQTASNVASTADTTGILYHDAAENDKFPAIYWGDAGNYNFVDNFSTASLVATLESANYAAPPKNLQGIRAMNGATLVGFVNNKIYFSEPNKYHAWPSEYEITVEDDIVAIEPVSSLGVVVLTKGYPYLISGTDPASVSTQRVDALYPCVSEKSVVSMNYGVVYATHEGIALYSSTAGPRLISASVHSKDTWKSAFPIPANLVGTYFNDAYLLSDGVSTIAFYFDEQTGGDIISFDEVFTATWYDSETNNLFFSKGVNGQVYKWDDTTQSLVDYQWKSKVIVSADFVNFGAARIVADYDGINSITFNMWVNKTLIFTTQVSSGAMFRLPTGYRSDTFEISVTGKLRLRSIHVADTPLGLKEI